MECILCERSCLLEHTVEGVCLDCYDKAREYQADYEAELEANE